MSDREFRHEVELPNPLRSGQKVFEVRRRDVEKQEEYALILFLITNMNLFGHLYYGLRPDYFENMPLQSGVLIAPLVPIDKILYNETFPGDIDILIIPYEHNFLILKQCTALEVKIVRVKYTKQGKSPNEFGVSQSQALINLGFPTVGLLHLIVSDTSPTSAWKEFSTARVIDKNGRAKPTGIIQADPMPINLLDRAFGRLKSLLSAESEIGISAVYLGADTENIAGGSKSIFFPLVRQASDNKKMSLRTVLDIKNYIDDNMEKFINLPRYNRK